LLASSRISTFTLLRDQVSALGTYHSSYIIMRGPGKCFIAGKLGSSMMMGPQKVNHGCATNSPPIISVYSGQAPLRWLSSAA
jgi:hypothetical protein